jgi:hypothetical protein
MKQFDIAEAETKFSELVDGMAPLSPKRARPSLCGLLESGQARADQVGYLEGQNPDRRQIFWTNSKKARSARSQSAPVRLLLDTQIALESQLKKARLLMDKADPAPGSAISAWEIAIEASHGRIRPRLGCCGCDFCSGICAPQFANVTADNARAAAIRRRSISSLAELQDRQAGRRLAQGSSEPAAWRGQVRIAASPCCSVRHAGLFCRTKRLKWYSYHRSISAFCKVASPSGDCCSSGATALPNSAYRALRAGSARAAATAVLSLATISFGVFFGAHSQSHVEKYAPGTPASSAVGMLGAASRRRFAMNA